MGKHDEGSTLRSLARPLLLLAMSLGVTLGARTAPVPASRPKPPMSAMPSMSVDWFASHARAGAMSTVAPSAMFTVQNFRFDLDGSALTQVDTARIEAGQSVAWEWVSGLHTVTSGTGYADPAAGQLFDQPMSTTSRIFVFQYDSGGVYPFFCRYDETSNMRGVVLVHTTVPTRPQSWGALKRRYAR